MRRFNDKRIFLAIIAISLIAYFPLLFSQSIIWDDSLIYYSIVQKKFYIIYDWLLSERHPQRAYISWFIGMLPNFVFWNKVISFVSVIVCWCFTAICLKEINIIKNIETLVLVVLVGLVYPIYSLQFSLTMVPYSVSHALYWVAVYFVVKHIQRNKIISIPLLLSLPLLFLAFSYEALLFHFYAILLVLFYYNIKRNIRPIKLISLLALPALFPIIYYLWTATLSMPIDTYTDYNRILFPLNFLLVLKNLVMSIIYLFATPLMLIKMYYLKDVTGLILIFIFVLLLCSVCYRFLWEPIRSGENLKKEHCSKNSLANVNMLITGFWLLIVSLLPYCLINKPLYWFGLSTRYGILATLPLALIVVSIFNIISERLKIDHRLSVQRILFSSLVIIFSSLTLLNLISWENKHIKHLSIVEHLKSYNSNSFNRVLTVKDLSEIGYPDRLSISEINLMFYRAWGKVSQVGIVDGSELVYTFPKKEHRKYYMLEDVNLKEGKLPQKTAITQITVLRDTNLNMIKLYLKYNINRFFGDRELFLQQLIKLDIKETYIN